MKPARRLSAALCCFLFGRNEAYITVMKNVSKQKAVFSILCLILSFQSIPAFSQTQSNKSSRKNSKFVNGQWFDGKSFQPQTFYSDDGILTKKRPRGDIETVDLANAFVVPPFAEAHNHNLGSAIYLNRELTQRMIQRYLAEGIFYVKIPGNPADNAATLRRELVNRPDSVDVTFANCVLTSKDGHPIGMTLDSFKQAGAAIPSVAELEGKGFFIIESKADFARQVGTNNGGQTRFY